MLGWFLMDSINLPLQVDGDSDSAKILFHPSSIDEEIPGKVLFLLFKCHQYLHRIF